MTEKTVLIIEDDHMIRQLVRLHLEKHHFGVIEASDGHEAQEIFLTYRPCLVILDLMLPELSGETFCKWLREQEGQDPSIIMLTAKTQTNDKIAGLRMGADDYVTKPFDPDELMAHVEAVMRRTKPASEHLIDNGLCIKPQEGKVLLYDQELHLTKHEFTLLYYFMQHADMVLSREQLVDKLYPYVDQIVLERTIDAHIKKIREKIEDNASYPERIQTVRGMGYKFVSHS